MKIRRAVYEDVPAVAALEKACFSRPWSEQSFFNELERRDSWFYVCEEKGKLAGFILLRSLYGEGEIMNVAVDETMRRRGVGRALMENALSGAEKLGIKKLYLEVRKSNAPARALYGGCGFTVCGLRKNYYDDPREDAVLMEADVPSCEKEG